MKQSILNLLKVLSERKKGGKKGKREGRREVWREGHATRRDISTVWETPSLMLQSGKHHRYILHIEASQESRRHRLYILHIEASQQYGKHHRYMLHIEASQQSVRHHRYMLHAEASQGNTTAVSQTLDVYDPKIAIYFCVSFVPFSCFSVRYFSCFS